MSSSSSSFLHSSSSSSSSSSPSHSSSASPGSSGSSSSSEYFPPNSSSSSSSSSSRYYPPEDSSSSSSSSRPSSSSWRSDPEPEDEAGCGLCDRQNKSCDASEKPVRYFNGEVQVQATDVATGGFGLGWSHTRTYTNRMREPFNRAQGWNWNVENWPYLVNSPFAGSSLALLGNLYDIDWFQDDGGRAYTTLFGKLKTLVHDDAHKIFRLIDADGTVTVFNDMSHETRPGLFKSVTSPGGNTTEVLAYQGGDILEVQRSFTEAGDTITESYLYDVYESGPHLNNLERVTIRRKVNSGAWKNVLKAEYTYHGSTANFGSLNDLESVTRYEWGGTGWDELDVSCYRYWKTGDPNGFEHGLKYVVGPEAYARMQADGLNPLTASNAQVAQYADNYYEYNGDKFATKEIVDGGARTFTFAYTENPNYQCGSDRDFNFWMRKTVETLPDGTQNIVYTNDVGHTMLKVVKSGSDEWYEFTRYDDVGRATLEASSAAVSDYDDAHDDLLIYNESTGKYQHLNDDAGLIRTRVFYTTTGSGAAEGYIQRESIQEGQDGDEVKLREWEYASHIADGVTVHPVSKETAYRNEDGTGAVETSYAYTFTVYEPGPNVGRISNPSGSGAAAAKGRPIKIYIGTDDTGATETDPTGGGAQGNNMVLMVLVTEYEYDQGSAGGNGNLTKQTQHVNATTTRVTTFTYDWRNRQTDVDGEIDFYQKLTHDNLNQVVKTERFDATPSGNLIGRQETFYDDLGRAYHTVRYAVDPSDGTVGNSLTDETWYDESGNVLKQAPAGSKLFTKSVYDGLNRETTQYIGYHVDETGYTEAGALTGDTILEQSEAAYNEAGNVVETTSRQRFHNATGTGALTDPSGLQPKARVAYSAAWHDGVGRAIAQADYGTNGGASFTRPATVPARSDDVLVVGTVYNDTGEVESTTDPTGLTTRVEYDHAGRRTKTIENYVPTSSSSSSSSGSSTGDCPPSADENRTTRFTYTADGNQKTLTAENANTTDQTTTYIYGTTLADSDIATSTLLRRVKYPDSTGDSDSVEYKYNRQSERTEIKDQRGSVRTLDYDKLGRQTDDRVTTLGTDVDGAVRRLSVAYEVRGLIETLTSHDDADVGQGSVINEVELAYNDFGQPVTTWQAHDGAVNTSTTPKVQYAYADGSNNTIRQTQITYPNAREVNYDYGAADAINYLAGRIESILDDDGTPHLVGYAYLGLGSIVEVDYPEPDVRYRLFDTSAFGDIYTGLDRFGRVIDCRWHNYGTSTDAVRLKYGYDRASNRIWREDVVAASNGKHFDELYTYDGLHRLKDMQRGALNAQKTAVTNLQFAQCWSLDETGNWQNFREDEDGNGSWTLNQTRTANPVNEITNVAESAGPSWATPAYDKAGNMTTVPKPKDPTEAFTAKYDAWNRLVKLEDATTGDTIQQNEYDARRFRTMRKDYDGGTLDETRHFYFSESWQSIEERIDSSSEPESQHIWGLRYIDDIVCRDRDTNSSGSFDEGLYALQDGNWNVVALVDANGSIEERFSYLAYGSTMFLSSTFSMQASSEYRWRQLFAGYRLDILPQLYAVRRRVFHSEAGRWLSRDPIAYGSDTNLHAYSEGPPAVFVDPRGEEPFDVSKNRIVQEIRERNRYRTSSLDELLKRATPDVRRTVRACKHDPKCLRALGDVFTQIAETPNQGFYNKWFFRSFSRPFGTRVLLNLIPGDESPG